jgi:DNA (cytosine-5)-methyltransferase 1
MMRALDLFCGAGGASMGLHRAGFQVVGVDIRRQPRYPFEFHQADALTFPLDGFSFIWASPPCQGYTAMRHAPGAKGAPKLIGAIRDRLIASGALWVIENVEAAAGAMRDPITLCGSMFGLGAQGCRLERHRLFEANFPILAPPCRHDSRPVIGVYGGHARRRAASAGGRGTRDVWEGGHRSAASQALGIDWMTLVEMSEAIPPAYAEHIGAAAIAASTFGAEVRCRTAPTSGGHAMSDPNVKMRTAAKL